MPKKVFELAKEFDLRPLDLVEILNSRGLSVKSHMTSLSDEDVEKAISFLRPTDEGDKKKKKATKKKTVKKKVVKKKVVKKPASETPANEEKLNSPEEIKSQVANEEEVNDTEDRPKTVRVKKSNVAARKKKAKEQEAMSTSKSLYEEDMPKVSGLRVIARPEIKKEEPVEVVETKNETDNTLDMPKQHVFTPVYIPEKKVTTEKAQEEEEFSDDDENSPKSESKKRLGGLATMMSGKAKAPANRSRDLTQMRADEELKTYSVLGNQVYTPVGRKKVYTGATRKTEKTEIKDSKRVISIHGSCEVVTLAKKLNIKFKELVDKALDLNLLIKHDDFLGPKLCSELAALYKFRVEDKSFREEEILKAGNEAKSTFPPRNPIITIMGHVDHGKTTLLDYIRSAKVASGEAGGITQHIGAYSVKVKNSTLTFLDTPGHAAFASMRQRGADVTDIVVLVVAADDGVMPQTKESIRFCKNANRPIIVAVNKMDKEQANPDRVKQELIEFELTAEEWGGDTIFCPISALNGDGVDDLLENIAIQAEMMELTANDKGQAEGVVIESKVEQGRGPVATVIIQSGTLNKGDSIVVGETFGRARNLTDHLGKQLSKAGPSTPVQILGLVDAPNPGEILNVVKNEREAKKIVQNRIDERKVLEATPSQKKVSLEDFFSQAPLEGQEKKELNLIIRSDVQGSFEAIRQALESLGNNEVGVKVVGGGVGPISDSDVNMAISTNGFILGFNMRPVTSARRLAEDKGVDIKTYSIIYELINDIKLALEGLLDPEFVEEYIGRAEVRETFSVPKVGVIAGSHVIDGKIERGCSIRLLRDGKIVFDGKLSSLKRFKDDVKEVKSGYECGVGMENFNDIKIGDIFESYLMVEKKRSLDSNQKTL